MHAARRALHMTLAPGVRLGPYEVVDALGAGGMGEVYRATDTRLDRTVAIKVLPAQVAADPALRERFEREARAVGALSHPNICTLHDVGRQRPARGAAAPDESDPPVDFLVMECLDGETLARRLERGALPLDEALGIAGDIAEALDAAHRRGIVHRDLKPANVMLTSTGVKLLDFGLARLREPDASDDDPSGAPTRAALTVEGSLLGTLQYMSPEQLDGKPVDARSDVFAFGATLYEMLAGARPFDGDGQASVIGSILKDEPAPLREVRPRLPRQLDRLVRTCLAKDPDDRWQTMRDLKRELRWLAQSGGAAEEPTEAASGPTGGSGLAGWRLALGAVVPALIAAAAAWTLKPAPAPPAAGVERFVIEVGEGQELGGRLAVSPDGRRLVYLVAEDGTTRLYLRDLDAFASAPIEGTEGIDASLLFFSPDGRDIGFGRIEAGENRTLNRIPAAGGSPFEIARLAGQLAGAVWRPDGTIVVGVVGTGLVSVPAAGGQAQPLTRVSDRPGDLAHGAPIAVPGREEILFQIAAGAVDDPRSRQAVHSPDGTVSVLGEGSGFGWYLETGHWLYTAPGGALLARRLDLDAGAFDGEPIQIPADDLDSLGPFVNQSFGGATRAWIRRPDGGLRTLTWVDRAGNEEPLPLDPALYRIARVSPDGRRIALDRGRPNARDLWVFDLARDTLSPLFLDPGDDESPVWTPDGRQIVFTSGRDGEANLHLREADGTGPVERLSASEDLQWPQSWSPDGRTLVFSRRVRTGPAVAQTLDTMMIRLDADRTVSPLLASEFTESNPAVSPDGRWIAYRSDESGRNEVYVQRFPEMGGRVQISTAGGTAPLWSSDSTELFYRQGEAMMAVAVDGTGAAFGAGPPVRLFEGRYLDDLARNYDVAPDGRFLMIKQADTLKQIHVVVNWIEDLRPFLASR